MIDYEATSFGFNRRKDFVKALAVAKEKIADRRKHPGHENVGKLDRAIEALDELLRDDAFIEHVRPQAEVERTHQPAAKMEP